MNKRTELPTAENSSNFNRIAGATCQVGTTLENLKAAVCGETGASAKYAACAKLAKEKGLRAAGPPVGGHQRRRAGAHPPGGRPGRGA